MEPTNTNAAPGQLDAQTLAELGLPLPDHLHLPETDGTIVKNFQEHPQSILLTDSIGPVLQKLYPDGEYCIGQDCGIYWRPPRPLEEPTRAAVAPDWFLVPGRPPLLDGKVRRSYVIWQELLSPSPSAPGGPPGQRDNLNPRHQGVGTRRRSQGRRYF